MINSFKADWRKLRQRPAVWVLGGIMLSALLLFGYVIPWLQLAFPSANFHPDPGTTLQQMKAALYPINFLKNSLTGVGIIGGILTLILGALVAGGEFNWGTVKTVYTQRPGRLQTLAGQVGVVSVIAAIFAVRLAMGQRLPGRPPSTSLKRWAQPGSSSSHGAYSALRSPTSSGSRRWPSASDWRTSSRSRASSSVC